jgi:hypothetical protein
MSYFKKCNPTHILSKTYISVEKSSAKMWSTYVIKKPVQSKQSPNGRQFAQSGHPAAGAPKINNEGLIS